MKSILTQGGFIFFYIIVLGAWINGCVHSFKKHNDDPEWLQRSPIVIYRGIEYFWHDDFVDVDWNQRIKNDAGTVCYLIELSAETNDVDGVKMQIEEFSKKIKDYPKDKKDSLKFAGSSFITYINYMATDMGIYLDSVIGGAEVEPSKWDKHTAYFEENLKQKFDLPTREDKKILDSMAIAMRLNWGFGEVDKVREYHIQIKKRGPVLVSTFKDAYYRIFNERM